MQKQPVKNKALVLGRIGLLRSLGREAIPIVVAREDALTLERASRYCRDYITLPNLDQSPEAALQLLEQYGSRQNSKPVIFLNAESDVLLVSKFRERLSRYYHILLAPDPLIVTLVNKDKFGKLAEEYDLPVPKTFTPSSNEECLASAEAVGYPCIMKPVRQRLWHKAEVLRSIGLHKAILVANRAELKRILGLLPPLTGEAMIQQYIPGNDQQHFDFHSYIDQAGNPRGYLVGHKIRINPIHFGTGTYTHYVEEPDIARLCLQVMNKIGYTGVANINLKRHAVTGQDYILEINPRYSVWTIIDAACGVNLPLLHYCDAVGTDIPMMRPSGKPRRWLQFSADFESMLAYRRNGEWTFWEWLQSYFTFPGKIEFHLFAWDDPMPMFASWLIKMRVTVITAASYLKRGVKKLWQ